MKSTKIASQFGLLTVATTRTPTDASRAESGINRVLANLLMHRASLRSKEAARVIADTNHSKNKPAWRNFVDGMPVLKA